MPETTTTTERLIADVESVLRGVTTGGVGDAVLRSVAEAYVRGRVADPRADASRTAFGRPDPLALVAFDTAGIQEYVFECDKPLVSQGASNIVAALTDGHAGDASVLGKILRGTHGTRRGAVVYAGGGGGLLLVAAAEAAGVCAAITGHLADASAGAIRSAAVHVAVAPNDLERGSRYQTTVRRLLARLTHERARAAVLHDAVLPRAGRCEHCRVRAVQGKAPCIPCRTRMESARDAREETHNAKSFGDIVGPVGDSGMAVLYADGANVGGALLRLETLAQFAAFSSGIESALLAAREAGEQLIQEGVRRLAGKEVRAFQAPICGGDDLLMVLPAALAFDAALKVVGVFEAKFDVTASADLAAEFGPQARDCPGDLRTSVGRLGLGVGVAIADQKFPFRYLRRYAQELLKSAKRRLRETSGDRSAIDFEVLYADSPLAGTVEESRAGLDLPKTNVEPRRLLTRRPYRTSEFRALLDQADALGRGADLGRSQLYSLRNRIEAGYHESCSYWRYQHARAEQGRGWAAYRANCPAARESPRRTIDELLWLPAPGGGVWTDLLDAMDVLKVRR